MLETLSYPDIDPSDPISPFLGFLRLQSVVEIKQMNRYDAKEEQGRKEFPDFGILIGSFLSSMSF